MNRRTMTKALATTLSSLILAFPGAVHADSTREVPVTLTGGFTIAANDYGRPVTLIASMLRVTPDVFRQAFSGVTPARGGSPTEAQAQANKVALLRVLAPYGVTNAKMDAVADYYRFNPQQGQTWPHRSATAVATVQNGCVTGFRIVDPGVGYTYAPTVTVPGFPAARATATIAYTTSFDTNGTLAGIRLNP